MPVTDYQVATLRAQLAGDLDEHKRLLRQFDNQADGRAYVTLTLNAAFLEAAERRFGQGATLEDVTTYIAEVRSRTARVGDELDPMTAERVLHAAITGEDISDIDPKDARRSQRFLLAAMIADEQLDDAGLDELVAKARASADEILA